jgi:hypothetical protein
MDRAIKFRGGRASGHVYMDAYWKWVLGHLPPEELAGHRTGKSLYDYLTAWKEEQSKGKPIKDKKQWLWFEELSEF